MASRWVIWHRRINALAIVLASGGALGGSMAETHYADNGSLPQEEL